MEKNTITVSCVKKYVKAGEKYNNEVYVLAPGHEWGHLYLCSICGEVVYSYDNVKDVNQHSCPKCNTHAENNFLDYPNNIMLDGRLYKIDYDQINARFDEPTEFVSFPKLETKGVIVDRDKSDGDGSMRGRLSDKKIKDGWDHLLKREENLKNKANKKKNRK